MQIAHSAVFTEEDKEIIEKREKTRKGQGENKEVSILGRRVQESGSREGNGM